MAIVPGSTLYHPVTGTVTGYQMTRPASASTGYYPTTGPHTNGSVSTPAAISDPRAGPLPKHIMDKLFPKNPLSTVPDWGTGGRKPATEGMGLPLMYLVGGALVLLVLMRRKK